MQGTLGTSALAEQGEAYRELQRQLTERSRIAIRDADPRVGLDLAFHLTSNWGNDAARAELRKFEVARSKLNNRRHREFVRLEAALYPERVIERRRWS